MERMVTYYEHEHQMARMERTNRRMWIICIILIIALVGTNIGWLYYEAQFVDTVTTEIEAEQQADGGGSNYLVNGNYGTAEGQNNDN